MAKSILPNLGSMIDHPLVQPEPNTGCWIWCGVRGQKGRGHGMVWVGDRMRFVHRVSWQKERGAIPEDRMVLHRCNNPWCCNPEHLYLGTQSDNARDRWANPRSYFRKGSEVPNAKLTEAVVKEAKGRNRAGESGCSLAREYGVSTAVMNNALVGRSWKHVQ